MLFDPLNSVNEMIFNAHRRAREITTLFEIIEEEDHLRDSEFAKPLTRLEDALQLNGVSVSYDSELDAGVALDNIDLRLERGTTTALST
jgi:ABC-type multidrug transport system fused ATPase/permease subunit